MAEITAKVDKRVMTVIFFVHSKRSIVHADLRLSKLPLKWDTVDS